MASKGKRKTEPLSLDELKKLINESGMAMSAIEKSIKMPADTLRKCLYQIPNKDGYIRTIPTKWVPKLVAFLKKKKLEEAELKEEVQEILKVHNIPVKEVIVEIPDEDRKLAWIAKLQEAKNGTDD